MREILVCTALFNCLFVCSPIASADRGATATMPTVEVVASPVVESTRVTDYASEVTTVTSKQIEASGALDLPSALRWVPGVNISRYNAVGSYGGAEGGSIYIRGMGAERPGGEIQVLIDGKPLFQGIFTHPLMDLLSVDFADRIEIYKSAQPVFFGNMSNAVVNIITKKRKKAGFETRAGAAYGTWSTFNASAQHGGKVDKLDYYLMTGFKSSAGHRPNADGRLQSNLARLGYAMSEAWNLSFNAIYTDNWADDPRKTTDAKIPVVPEFATRDGIYDLTLSNTYVRASGEAKIFLDNGVVRWRQYDASKGGTYYSNTDWKTSGVKLQERLNLWTGGEITLGYDYIRYGGTFKEERVTGTSSSLEDSYFFNSAPYAAVQSTFGDTIKVTPSAGVRYNASSNFGSDLGSQAGIVVRRGGTEVHAQYAHGFNLPGLYVVYNYQVWGRGDAWKTLQAETIDHYEIGAAHAFSEKLRASVTFFKDDGKNRLIYKTSPNRFENLASYATQGIEAILKWTPSRDIDIFGGGSYLNTSANDISYSPKYTVTGGFNTRFLERFSLNMDAQYVSAYYASNPRYPTSTPGEVGNNFLLNGKLSYRLSEKGAPVQTTLYVSGDNLLNRQVEYLTGYPAPGILLMGGFHVSL